MITTTRTHIPIPTDQAYIDALDTLRMQIHRLRGVTGHTQQTLAAAVHIARSTLSLFEIGKQEINPDAYNRIIAIFADDEVGRYILQKYNIHTWHEED